MRSLGPPVLAILLLGLSVPVAAQDAPSAGAWLRYQYRQDMRDQQGAYVGYQEVTLAHARYEVRTVEAQQATIDGRYAWTYSSSDEYRTDRVRRTAQFWLSNRRYIGFQTDLSDYDELDGRVLATWIWIPPSTPEGATVEILERDFLVESRRATVTAAGSTRPAIYLRSTGEVVRDDDYGRMNVAIVDEYWFDPATGMFLREHLVERSNGRVEGEAGGFVLETVIEVQDASYAPNPAAPPEPSYDTPPIAPRFHRAAQPSSSSGRSIGYGLGRVVCGAVPGLAFAGVIAFLVWVSQSRKRRRLRTASGEELEMVELAAAPIPGLGPLSPLFDPFIPHMVAVARATGQRVFYAKSGMGRVHGVAIEDAPAKVSTIFAPETVVCEALRSRIGQPELFSETRHPRLPYQTGAHKEAYNVYETYELLELTTPPEDLGYDTEVIDPMHPADVPEVAALFQAVYGIDCRPWLQSSLALGDLGWVARVDGRVVGAALATVVGDRARLHGLTVHGDRRGHGLGTALYKARLRGLFDLGTNRVLTECATWNLGALDLARAHGFAKVGLMYVESARPVRVERKFLRR